MHQKIKGFAIISSNYKLVTQECYDLLHQFNLPKGTQFFPIQLVTYKTKQRVNDHTYYLMNLTEDSWRSYLLPSFCEGKLRDRYRKNGEFFQALSSGYEFDNAIALSAEASNCDLDLWHDPALQDSMFMSDRLKHALEQAGFIKHWGILTTQLIQKQ